jgi:hypothetical protein
MRTVRWLTILPVLLFAWLVWPTPYRYITVDRELIRVSRITGVASRLTTVGWYVMMATPTLDSLYQQSLRRTAIKH